VAQKTSKKINHPSKAASTEQLPSAEKAIIHILGESPMVEEFAAVCMANGYEVYITLNEGAFQNSERASQFNVTNAINPKTAIGIELTNTALARKKQNLELLAHTLADTAPIISSSVVITATAQSAWIAGKHRLVGIAALP